MLERLALSHLSARGMEGFERRPVHTQNNTVCSSVNAGSIRPCRYPAHGDATNVWNATVRRHVIANVVVAQLQQSSQRSYAAVRGQQLPVVTLLVNDVRSLNWRRELAKIHRIDDLLDEILAINVRVRERSVSPPVVGGA